MAAKTALLALLLLASSLASHAAFEAAHKPLKGRVFGARVPRTYFVVQGFGDTDEGSGTDPFETGAHDLAMEDAGIHEFNLMQYTSVLPAEAQEISLEQAHKHPGWRHGAVLECIMSEIHGGRGDRITAGVGRMVVSAKRDGKATEVMGGLATEYKGHGDIELAQQQLDEALEELFKRRFLPEDHEMGDKKYNISSKVVEKAFGTAMAGLCFIDYVFPEIEMEVAPAQDHVEL